MKPMRLIMILAMALAVWSCSKEEKKPVYKLGDKVYVTRYAESGTSRVRLCYKTVHCSLECPALVDYAMNLGRVERWDKTDFVEEYADKDAEYLWICAICFSDEDDNSMESSLVYHQERIDKEKKEQAHIDSLEAVLKGYAPESVEYKALYKLIHPDETEDEENSDY